MGKKEASKKKTKRNVVSGVVKITASFNNTIITITDGEGNALVQGTPAAVGFKGSKKSTAYAATKAAKDAAERAMKKYGLSEVKVFINGPGNGRIAAVKGLDSAGLQITQLVEATGYAHNGCRPRKAPRK